jgi:hypothetical protein
MCDPHITQAVYLGILDARTQSEARVEALEAEVERLRGALLEVKHLTYYKAITDKTVAWRLAHAVFTIAREALRATLPATTRVMAHEGVPPDAIVMAYGDKQTVVRGLAPEEEA